jgi:hypothetical protein
VLRDEQERPIYEDNIRETINAMKDAFEDQGGVLLEKRVQELKREKRRIILE